MRRLLALLTAAVALAACSGDGGTDLATIGLDEALASAAESGADVETYRLEAFTTTELELDDGTTLTITPELPDVFEFDGELSSQLLRSVGAGFLEGAAGAGAGDITFEELRAREDELVIEQIVTPDALYQLNRFGQVLGEVLGVGSSPEEQLLASGEWLRVAPEGLGLTPEQLAASQSGSTALGPELLATLESIDGLELEDLGLVDVAGVETRAFRADLTLAELTEAGSGFDPTGALAGLDDDLGITDLQAALLSSEVTITVHVDEDLQTRRIALAGAFPADGTPGVRSISIDGHSDVLDVGDPSIEVVVPERWTDATDVFRQLLGVG